MFIVLLKMLGNNKDQNKGRFEKNNEVGQSSITFVLILSVVLLVAASVGWFVMSQRQTIEDVIETKTQSAWMDMKNGETPAYRAVVDDKALPDKTEPAAYMQFRKQVGKVRVSGTIKDVYDAVDKYEELAAVRGIPASEVPDDVVDEIESLDGDKPGIVWDVLNGTTGGENMTGQIFLGIAPHFAWQEEFIDDPSELSADEFMSTLGDIEIE